MKAVNPKDLTKLYVDYENGPHNVTFHKYLTDLGYKIVYINGKISSDANIPGGTAPVVRENRWFYNTEAELESIPLYNCPKALLDLAYDVLCCGALFIDECIPPISSLIKIKLKHLSFSEDALNSVVSQIAQRDGLL